MRRRASTSGGVRISRKTCQKDATMTYRQSNKEGVGLTFKSTSRSLPQEQALVFERLSRPHHVLLAEGVAVLQLGSAAVFYAVPHLL